MRPRLFALSLAGALAGALFASAPAMAATVYVANERAGSLTVIDEDAPSNRTLALDMLPHNVDLTPDGKNLLIVGMPGGHGDHGEGGRLLVLDALNPAASATTVIVGGHLAHVVPDTNGKLAFITDADSHAVLVTDLAAGRVVERIQVGRYPHGLRLSPDGQTLAVANRDSDDVSLIDVTRRQQIARIAVGKKPVQVAFAPDGQRLFVSLSGENAVAAVDPNQRTLIDTYPVGPGPIQLSVSPDGKQLVVANQGSEQAPGHSLSILDTATGRLIASPEVGKGAHGVSIAGDGTRAYISNAFDDSVSVVDLGTHKELTRYPTEAGPNGIVAH
jgi:YVTN family beta-propeller protein